MARDDRPKNGWTFDTLLTHVIALIAAAEYRTADRFSAQREAVAAALAAAEKAVNAALAANEKAVALSESNSERWRASANEWRGAMDDRETRFVKLGEYQLTLQQLREIKDHMGDYVRMSEFNQARKMIDDNKTQLQNMAGRGQGWESGWKILLGLVTAAGVVVAIYFSVKGK